MMPAAWRHVAPVALCVFLAACGGRSRGGVYVSDSGTDPPDAGPTAFCDGDNKARLDGVTVQPAAVTSTRVIMDCCEGFTLLFHTQGAFGTDVSVGMIFMTELPLGVHDVADPPDGHRMFVIPPGEPWPDEVTGLSGTYELTATDDPYMDPLQVSLCVALDAPGDPLHGLELYAHQVPVMSYNDLERLALYRLEDPDMTAVEAASVPLGSLALHFTPLVTIANFTYYSRSTHTVHWDPWYSEQLSDIENVPTQGLPFVMVVDDEPIYLGAFMTNLSSVALDLPVIVLEDIGEDSVTIDYGYPGPAAGPDPRADPRVIEVLQELGKLAP